MKFAFVATMVLAFPLLATAQRNVTLAPPPNSQGTLTGATSPGFQLPGGLNPPAGLFDQFWDDPATAAELHLTDAQRKQLQEASLTQRLSLIDGGADALKAITYLSAILDADHLDEAAYKQQLTHLADATGKLVQGVGEMALSPRRVLTVEQWRKLQTLQRAKRAASASAVSPRQPATRMPTGEKP